ncbi:hypothetical protein TB2_001133 [Malus domestica]
MVARNNHNDSRSYGESPKPDNSSNGVSYEGSSGFKPTYNKNKNKGKFQYNATNRFGNSKPTYGNYTVNPAPGILGTSPPRQQSFSGSSCQICGKFGHLAPTCRFGNIDGTVSEECQICGKKNHGAKYCHFRNSTMSFSSPATLHVKSTQSSEPSAPPQQFWLTDSGASSHMTADMSNMSLASPYPTNETIQTASGAGLSISHIGSSTLHTPLKSLQLNSVLCVPRLSQNLLSVHQLCLDNNCCLIYDAFCFWIQDKATWKILFQGRCSNGLYPIPLPVSHKAIPAQIAYLGHQISSCLWHNRLGHPSNSVLSVMLKKCHLSVLPDSVSMMCHTCLEGKFCKLSFVSSVSKSIHPFQVVHSDVWGPSPCTSIDGFRYYVTFIDECTRHCWLFPIINKSDVFSTFVGFYNYISNHFATSIKTLQSDGGGEYLSKSFQTFLLAKGVTHQLSCPYTPEQNGLAERKHRHILETAITLLQTATLPPIFWSFACQTVVYLINRMPSSTLHHKSPFELLFKVVPDINHLRIFGCSVFPLLKPYNSTKLQPKTTKCLFLGYASKYKGFICYDILHDKYYISRHVLFDESEFPYSHLSLKHLVSTNSTSQPVSISSSPSISINRENHLVANPFPRTIPLSDPMSSNFNHHSGSHSPFLQSITPSTAHQSPVAPEVPAGTSSATCNESPSEIPCEHGIEIQHEFQPDHLRVILPIPPMNTHSMQTRAKSGISKKKAYISVVQDASPVDLSQTEPATYKSALKSPLWLSAMQEELQALTVQNTWSLVPLLKTKNLIGCKWVFKLKKHADGSISR